ncbi:MAG: transcriptional regulator [Proteiniphilum sp.]|nr:transcriptional regulator [Proteiniphilum sp.]MDD4800923.1 transcriptional regulator [Proteiniphilum sp.]
MNVHQVSAWVNGKLLYAPDAAHTYSKAFASDLMSDVLRFQMENTVLITGLCTIQVLRTAEMSNISCIIFARGKRVTTDMLALAEENRIAVIESGLTLYEISGKLYRGGLQPVY